MRGRLWCIRLLLLLVVSALVLSPLAVSGASVASKPIGWNHDPSTLMLPSSPVYPAVVAYRDVRLSMADPSYEKAGLLLDFADQDAAAINTMARRQDFVSSANHATAYQDTFDRCVGWLVIADERGNDVSYLLSRVTNDHYAQQAALGEAVKLMPDWSSQGIEAARAHASEVLLQAIDLLGGEDAARTFVSNMALLNPDLVLTLPEASVPDPEPPQAIEISPALDMQTDDPLGDAEEVPAAPAIISLSADSPAVEFGDAVGISCTLASGDLEDLSYAWWCARGNLVASGTEATWSAPDRAGTYEISFTISDSLGRSDTKSVEVRVLESNDSTNDTSDEVDGSDTTIDDPSDAPAHIDGLVLTADHKYLSQSLVGAYSILVSRSCTVQCLVEDPDGLEFDWSATKGGKIAGSGEAVTFTAPSSPCYLDLSVTVTNARGEQETTSITIYVTTCTYCFS